MKRFNTYMRLRKKNPQAKEANIADLKSLAGQIASAFADAGRAPGLSRNPDMINDTLLGRDALRDIESVFPQGTDPNDIKAFMGAGRDLQRQRQEMLNNDMRALQFEQQASNSAFSNALGARKDTREQESHAWNKARADRDATAHDWGQNRDTREGQKHELMMEKLKQELQPSTFLGTLGETATNALGSSLGGGLGELVTSPLQGVGQGITTALSSPGSTYGYRLDKMLNSGFGGLMNRIKAPDIAAERFIENTAGNLADKATDLLADMASKSLSSLTDFMVDSPARRAILDGLRKEDPIISQMGEQEVMDAYHSIAKFAPTLAKDKNAVRSALRQAAQFEGGLDYMTIKGLAEAESAVSGERKR